MLTSLPNPARLPSLVYTVVFVPKIKATFPDPSDVQIMLISINLQDSLTSRSLNFHAGAVISRQTLCCAQKALVLLPDIVNMFEGIDGRKLQTGLQTGSSPGVLVALHGESFFESIRQTIKPHATCQSRKWGAAVPVPSTTNYRVSLARTLKWFMITRMTIKALLSNGGSSRVTFPPSLTWLKSRFFTTAAFQTLNTSAGAKERPKVSLWSPVAIQPAPERWSESTFCQSNRNQDGSVARGRRSALVWFQWPKFALIFSDFCACQCGFPAARVSQV